MARANRHYLPEYVWHITHRCHKREFLLKFARVGWEVMGDNGSYEVQEPEAPYPTNFGPENRDLSQENAFYWEESTQKSKG